MGQLLKKFWATCGGKILPCTHQLIFPTSLRLFLIVLIAKGLVKKYRGGGGGGPGEGGGGAGGFQPWARGGGGGGGGGRERGGGGS